MGMHFLHLLHCSSIYDCTPTELITVKLEYITELIFHENYIKVQSALPKCVILKQMNECCMTLRVISLDSTDRKLLKHDERKSNVFKLIGISQHQSLIGPFIMLYVTVQESAVSNLRVKVYSAFTLCEPDMNGSNVM